MRFRHELEVFHRVRHCHLLSSGTAALAVALRAIKQVRPNFDEVLIPAYTCYSVPAAIVRAGLKIRICDIEPETLDFDYADLERHLLTAKRLLCVVPTHILGLVSDVDRLRSMIGRDGPLILEDASQTMGARGHSGLAGTMGDVGIVSLGRGKVLSTVSGGVILTNNDDLWEAIMQLITQIPESSFFNTIQFIFYSLALSLFIKPNLFWLPKALPFLKLGATKFDSDFKIRQFTPFQAGLARKWQGLLSQLQNLRKVNVEHYLAAGVVAPSALRSQPCGAIRFPAYVKPTARKEIITCSESEGLGIAELYPTTVEHISGIGEYIVAGTGSNAEKVASRLVTLPVHKWVEERDIVRIIALLKSKNGDGMCDSTMLKS